MKQYFSGFISAICLSISFVMFTASQTNNLGDIVVNSIRVVDNENGGFITTYDQEGKITTYTGHCSYHMKLLFRRLYQRCQYM